MKPLYTKFKEYLNNQEQNKGNVQLANIINNSLKETYANQSNLSFKVYFFNNPTIDSPIPGGLSGIAWIFKSSENWGWILLIGNGELYLQSLENGIWKDWTIIN